jgi:hypothetical protein
MKTKLKEKNHETELKEQKFLSVWVAELMIFQCSKILDLDDNTYQIS